MKIIKLNTESFIEKAIDVHGDKYDYSITKCKGSTYNVDIVCPIHGKFQQLASNHLIGRGCKKCGTLKAAAKHTKVDKSLRKEYAAWLSMKRRCNNPLAVGYKDYGGRGIKICSRWLESFKNFIEDMSIKPSPVYTLERIDVNGNYCPDNCKWATRLEQERNKRKTHKVKYKGEIKSIAEWCDILNIDRVKTTKRIIKFKWPVDTAFEIPEKEHQKITIENISYNNRHKAWEVNIEGLYIGIYKTLEEAKNINYAIIK